MLGRRQHSVLIPEVRRRNPFQHGDIGMWVFVRSLETVILEASSACEGIVAEIGQWGFRYLVESNGITEVPFVGTKETASNQFLGHLHHALLAWELAGQQQ